MNCKASVTGSFFYWEKSNSVSFLKNKNYFYVATVNSTKKRSHYKVRPLAFTKTKKTNL